MRRRRLIPRTSWDPGFSQRIQLRNRQGFDLGFIDVSEDNRYYAYSFRTNCKQPNSKPSLLSAANVIIATHKE